MVSKPNAAETDHVTTVTNDLAGSMPDAKDSAIEAEKSKAEKATATAAGLVDNKGVSFNPDLHEVDADGNPRLTTSGKLRRKRGNKSGSKINGENEPLNIPGKPGAVSPSLEAAKATAGAIFTLGTTIGGDEWQPINDPQSGTNEYANMVDVWNEYYKSKGVKDIPPGIALSIAVIGYVTPRLFMPKTKSRLSRAKAWLVSKWILWRSNGGEKTDE